MSTELAAVIAIGMFFDDIQFDCPNCPLYPCPFVGTMTHEDCAEDILRHYAKKIINPS